MGGASQVGEQSIASAIIGNLNNGGLGCYGTLHQICDELCNKIESWSGDDDGEEYLDREKIQSIVRGGYTPDERYGWDSLPVPGYY